MVEECSSVFIPIVLLNFSQKQKEAEGGEHREERRCYLVSGGKPNDTKELNLSNGTDRTSPAVRLWFGGKKLVLESASLFQRKKTHTHTHTP